jgi:hypothetical protein
VRADDRAATVTVGRGEAVQPPPHPPGIVSKASTKNATTRGLAHAVLERERTGCSPLDVVEGAAPGRERLGRLPIDDVMRAVAT